MFCNQCGSQISEGAKFCPNCGNKVESEVENNEEEVVTPKITEAYVSESSDTQKISLVKPETANSNEQSDQINSHYSERKTPPPFINPAESGNTPQNYNQSYNSGNTNNGGAPYQTSNLAIVSLVLGIISMSGFGIFTGVPAIITGTMSLKKHENNKGLAVAGVITGAVASFIQILLIIIVIIAIILD